jgi:hypothetical protein
MLRIISALILAATLTGAALASEPIRLADNAPDHYVVVNGDTLWAIAGKFLKEPWRWPEIWRLNKEQIKNPHRIYPGDIVLLDYVDGQPRLRLGKPVKSTQFVKLSPEVHSEQISREIPSIPANVIEPFISRPLVVDVDDMKDAPQIIATDDARVVVGGGDNIYVLGITEDHPKWFIYRPGVPLKDPESGEVLGYEAFFLGTAEMQKRDEVSTLSILSAKEEVLKGDLLVPAEAPNLQAYVPRKPEADISGLLVSIYGGVGSGGKDSVIAISRGRQAGVEVGDVLALYSRRNTTFLNKDGRSETRALPEERYGLVFVFRTFDRVAYGLVMEASRPLAVGDAVRNP